MTQIIHKNNNKKVKLKITVIGDAQSGKSSFIHNLVFHQFKEKYQPTQNYQVTIYQIKNNGVDYQIHFWECGTNYFSNNKFIRKAFFMNSSATFLLFDLCNVMWKNQITKWIQQAYNFQSFLVYGIGTKKDIFDKKTTKQKLNIFNSLISHQIKKSSLFDEEHIENINYEYEQENNKFFNEYQIKHYYQSATQKVPYQIKNIFVSINDDKQKLSRSSLARGTKFDNSLAGGSSPTYFRQSKVRFGKQNFKNNVESILPGSIKLEQVDQSIIYHQK